MTSQVVLVVKNLPVNTGDARDIGLISGLGRSPAEGNSNPLQYILAWEISWTEKPSGLQSMGSQRVRRDLVPKNEVKKILFQSRNAYYLRGTVLIRALEIQTYLTLTKTLRRYISCLFIYSTKI